MNSFRHKPPTLGRRVSAKVATATIELAPNKTLDSQKRKIVDRCGNDPSAGSPTETLLRLHLPLNDKV